jgi:hypothetical protein
MEIHAVVNGKSVPVQALSIGGRSVRYLDYDINPQMLVMPWMHELPPQEWTPYGEGTRLGARLPYDWDDQYRHEFKQEYQPIRFMQNVISLCNYIQRCPERKDKNAATALLKELINYAETYLLRYNGVIFVEHKFDFVQKGVYIPAGWVSGCSQAFVLIAYTRIAKLFPEIALPIAKDLANAYCYPHSSGFEAPAYWISYIDEDDLLWFEEYPMPGGRPNLVLNGHIFAIHALHEINKIFPEERYGILAKVGITTIRRSIAKFRRKGKVNIYSILGPRKSDYMPGRTIRQFGRITALSQSILMERPFA